MDRFHFGHSRVKEKTLDGKVKSLSEEDTRVSEVNCYIAKLTSAHRDIKYWVTRSSDRREKNRRKMIVYVENDRRDHDTMRRFMGRRHAPDEDPDPKKVPARRNGIKASLRPAIPESGPNNWLTRAKNNLFSAIRRK